MIFIEKYLWNVCCKLNSFSEKYSDPAKHKNNRCMLGRLLFQSYGNINIHHGLAYSISIQLIFSQ